MKWAIRVCCAVQASAFGRHSAEQHLKKALRHKADFVAQCNPNCHTTDIFFRTFVLRADYQPLVVAEPQLSAGAVVAVILGPYDVEQITEDVVVAILDGRQPTELTFAKLTRSVPLNWSEQRTQLGFPALLFQK